MGTEILNYAQQVLHTRHVVKQLMQKCSRLAVEMERAVAMGASRITTQPKLLAPGWVCELDRSKKNKSIVLEMMD